MSLAMIRPLVAEASTFALSLALLSIVLPLALVGLFVWLIVGERRGNASGILQSPHQIATLLWACLVGGLVLFTLLGYWHGMVICIALMVAFKLALRGGLLRESSTGSIAAPPVITPNPPPASGRANCPQCGTALAAGAPQGLCPACLLRRGVATEDGAPVGERATFVPPPPAELAKSFPQFEILRFIGQGGMGAVYQARQPALDRLVALKILPPQAGRDPGFAERFNREARALARLNHPNIVSVHEFGQAGEFYYLVMEYVDGTNLRQLERTRKLAPREALAIVPQICDALQYAHDEGVVHRDIKPDNILVDRRGRVKIADFGLAKLLGQERKDFTITESNHVIGTPHYMAPEQIEHPQSVDHRADIYSLGVVFYEMLTGELPIGRFASPSQMVQVDVRLDEVVLRALEKEPDRRYQQASVLKTEVQTIVSTPPPVIGAPAAAARTEPPKGASPTEAAAGPGAPPVSPASPQAGTPAPPTEIVNTPQSSRLSRTAVVGLCWALLFFLAIIPTAIHAWTWSQRQHDGPSALILFLWIPLLLGLPAPFGTTVLGCVALSSIRRSAGRLYGLGLALFDALLFPLLVLDGIINGAVLIGLRLTAVDQYSDGAFTRPMVTHVWLALLVLALLVLIDFLIVRAAWRAAKRPRAGSPEAGTGSGAWKVVAAVFAGMMVIVAIPILWILGGMVVPAVLIARERVNRVQAPVIRQVEAPATFVFGPETERLIQARETGTNLFLDLDTAQLLTPPAEITNALADRKSNTEARSWQGLDIPKDSNRYRYVAWLRESRADLMYKGGGQVIGFDGMFTLAHGGSSTNWDDWNGLTPKQVQSAVQVVEWTRRASEATRYGLPPPPAPTPGGIYNSAIQLGEGEDPIVNQLTRDQSVTWIFKTREGGMGILQLADFTEDPRGVKIRYKLIREVEKPRPLDIARFYQSTILGPDESESPQGPILGHQVIDGVPFEIGGQIIFFGRSLAKSNSATPPSSVEGIQIGRKFDELHLIHFAKWEDVEGQTIARIRLHYADGTQSKLPILYGGHVRDWQRPPSEEKELLTDPASKIVWRGPGFPSIKSTTRLFKSTLTNPYPQKVVESMDVVSAQNLASYVLVAATVADQDPQRPLTPARAAEEPERNFDGSVSIHVVDAPGGRPVEGALVESRMTVDDVNVPAAPAYTTSAGDSSIRFPRKRTSSITVSVTKPGFTPQTVDWTSVIPDAFTIRLPAAAPGETSTSGPEADSPPSNKTAAALSMPPGSIANPIPETTPASVQVPPVPNYPPAPEAPEAPSKPYTPRASLIGSLLGRDEVRQDFNKTFPLADNGRLSLDNVNGRVEINGWNRDEVVIKAVKHGKTRESVEAVNIEVEAGPDLIAIHTKQPSILFGWRSESVTVDYTILVPRRARLKKVESVNGNIAIDGVSGDVEASAVNGEVRTRGGSGNQKLSTVNGEIATDLGSLGSGQSVSLDTVNGQIVAAFPEGADAEVSANTVNGRISSEYSSLTVKKEFPVGSNLKGTLGKGGARVKASTVNGSIAIRRGTAAR